MRNKTIIFLFLALITVLVVGCSTKPTVIDVQAKDYTQGLVVQDYEPLTLRDVSWTVSKDAAQNPLFCLSSKEYSDLIKNTDDVQNRLNNYMISIDNFKQFYAKK